MLGSRQCAACDGLREPYIGDDKPQGAAITPWHKIQTDRNDLA